MLTLLNVRSILEKTLEINMVGLHAKGVHSMLAITVVVALLGLLIRPPLWRGALQAAPNRSVDFIQIAIIVAGLVLSLVIILSGDKYPVGHQKFAFSIFGSLLGYGIGRAVPRQDT